MRALGSEILVTFIGTAKGRASRIVATLSPSPIDLSLLNRNNATPSIPVFEPSVCLCMRD